MRDPVGHVPNGKTEGYPWATVSATFSATFSATISDTVSATFSDTNTSNNSNNSNNSPYSTVDSNFTTWIGSWARPIRTIE